MSRQVLFHQIFDVTKPYSIHYTFIPDSGEEVLFKFEDYQHKDDKEKQTTNVERGVLEKIFFDM